MVPANVDSIFRVRTRKGRMGSGTDRLLSGHDAIHADDSVHIAEPFGCNHTRS
jgi:hypothetical protein